MVEPFLFAENRLSHICFVTKVGDLLHYNLNAYNIKCFSPRVVLMAGSAVAQVPFTLMLILTK